MKRVGCILLCYVALRYVSLHFDSFHFVDIVEHNFIRMNKELEQSLSSKPFLKGMLVSDLNGLCLASKVR